MTTILPIKDYGGGRIKGTSTSYRADQAGTVMSTRPKTNPRSYAYNEVGTIGFVAAAKAFGGLTQDQRADWHELRMHLATWQRHCAYLFSDINLFCEVNRYRHLAGLPIEYACPSWPPRSVFEFRYRGTAYKPDAIAHIFDPYIYGLDIHYWTLWHFSASFPSPARHPLENQMTLAGYPPGRAFYELHSSLRWFIIGDASHRPAIGTYTSFKATILTTEYLPIRDETGTFRVHVFP